MTNHSSQLRGSSRPKSLSYFPAALLAGAPSSRQRQRQRSHLRFCKEESSLPSVLFLSTPHVVASYLPTRHDHPSRRSTLFGHCHHCRRTDVPNHNNDDGAVPEPPNELSRVAPAAAGATSLASSSSTLGLQQQ